MRRRKTIIAAAAVVLAIALTAGLFLTSGTDHSARRPLAPATR
jgi:hypothetical protein